MSGAGVGKADRSALGEEMKAGLQDGKLVLEGRGIGVAGRFSGGALGVRIGSDGKRNEQADSNNVMTRGKDRRGCMIRYSIIL
jgi:hypothetical protein